VVPDSLACGKAVRSAAHASTSLDTEGPARPSVHRVVAHELDLPGTLAARTGLSIGSVPKAANKERLRDRMRKVHHPKIVQRADRRWLVVCDDCERDDSSSTPVGINTPVESFEVAQLMWENHCERRRLPMRRGA
jgi:hypothetical protein